MFLQVPGRCNVFFLVAERFQVLGSGGDGGVCGDERGGNDEPTNDVTAPRTLGHMVHRNSEHKNKSV